MNPAPDLCALTDAEIDEMDLITKTFTEENWQCFDHQLWLHAMVRGWTGDPMRQPPRVILKVARSIFRGRPAS